MVNKIANASIIKTILKFTCVSSIVFIGLSAKAQTDKWKELTLTNEAQYQAKGVIVKIYKETYSGLEGQQYTVKFTNTSTQKLKITGTLTATTYCGTAVNTSIDVIIKPGQSLGGNDYLMDNVGLTGTVHTEDCKTDKIYPNPNDKNTYKYDRISSLSLSAMSVMPVEDPNAIIAKNQTETIKTTAATSTASVSKAVVLNNTQANGQNSQQMANQQQANAYLNAAGTENSEIQKAMDLNLAKISAIAGGNKLLLAQIQQQQNIQSQQQTQAVSDAATTLVSSLLDAKFNRDQEKRQAQNERFQKYTAEQADLAVKKQAPMAAMRYLTQQDINNLGQTVSPIEIIKYVNNINRRFVKMDSIDKATSEAMLYTRDVTNPIVNLPVKVKTPNPYKIESYSVRHLDIINKDKNVRAIGAFAKSYYNGITYLKGSFSEKIAIDIPKAMMYLKEAEATKTDSNEVRDTKYIKQFNIFFGKHYENVQGELIQIGNIGLAQMSASVFIGDIYVDSATTTQQNQYLNLAFEHYAKAINYYFTYLNAYYQKNKNVTFLADRYKDYPVYFQSAFDNLVLVCNDIAKFAANGTDVEKAYAYNCAEFCKKACEAYYGFRVAIAPASQPSDAITGQTSTGQGIVSRNSYEKILADSRDIVADFQSGNINGALLKIKGRLAADPENKLLNYYAGSAYYKDGNKTLAEQYFKKALQLDPDFFEANIGISNLLMEPAMATFNNALRIPMSEQQQYLADMNKAKTQFNVAKPYILKAVEIRPRSIDALGNLKVYYTGIGDTANAQIIQAKIDALK